MLCHVTRKARKGSLRDWPLRLTTAVSYLVVEETLPFLFLNRSKAQDFLFHRETQLRIVVSNLANGSFVHQVQSFETRDTAAEYSDILF